MKCPHCKYEDLGDIVDGKWVDSKKEHGDHYSISTEEFKPTLESESYHTCQPSMIAERGYGYRRERRSVYGCASCGILFINE